MLKVFIILFVFAVSFPQKIVIVDNSAIAEPAMGHVEVNVIEVAPIKDVMSGKSSANTVTVPDCSDAGATQDCIPTEVVEDLNPADSRAAYARWRAIEEVDPEVVDDSTMPKFPSPAFRVKQ